MYSHLWKGPGPVLHSGKRAGELRHVWETPRPRAPGYTGHLCILARPSLLQGDYSPPLQCQTPGLPQTLPPGSLPGLAAVRLALRFWCEIVVLVKITCHRG